MKSIIISVLVLTMSILSITAQNCISVDSIHMLSNEQKQTLSYVKEMFNDRGGCIKVPIDALSVLGENKCDNNEISIIPEWELAYFEDNKNCEAFLYVPLRINYSEYNMNSELRVLFNKILFIECY